MRGLHGGNKIELFKARDVGRGDHLRMLDTIAQFEGGAKGVLS